MPLTRTKKYCLPSNLPLQSSQPQFEDGSVYRQNRPTRFDKIKNLQLDILVGAVAQPSPPCYTKDWREPKVSPLCPSAFRLRLDQSTLAFESVGVFREAGTRRRLVLPSQANGRSCPLRQ